jgi:hypothetical protein
MHRLYELIGACISAAIVAACGGSNNGFPSLTPLSVAHQIGVRKSSAGVIYSFNGGRGTAQHRKPCRFSAVACGGNLGFFFRLPQTAANGTERS